MCVCVCDCAGIFCYVDQLDSSVNEYVRACMYGWCARARVCVCVSECESVCLWGGGSLCVCVCVVCV